MDIIDKKAIFFYVRLYFLILCKNIVEYKDYLPILSRNWGRSSILIVVLKASYANGEGLRSTVGGCLLSLSPCTDFNINYNLMSFLNTFPSPRRPTSFFLPQNGRVIIRDFSLRDQSFPGIADLISCVN